MLFPMVQPLMFIEGQIHTTTTTLCSKVSFMTMSFCVPCPGQLEFITFETPNIGLSFRISVSVV
jgi:hypothetical protein